MEDINTNLVISAYEDVVLGDIHWIWRGREVDDTWKCSFHIVNVPSTPLRRQILSLFNVGGQNGEIGTLCELHKDPGDICLVADCPRRDYGECSSKQCMVLQRGPALCCTKVLPPMSGHRLRLKIKEWGNFSSVPDVGKCNCDETIARQLGF
jgi:hypothetical protein